MALVGISLGTTSTNPKGATAEINAGVSVYTSAGIVDLSGTIVDDLSGQLQPGNIGGTALQRVGWRVSVDGTEVTDCVSNQGVQVSRSISRPIQTAAFSLFTENGVSTLGDPLRLGAPLTGLKSIDVGLAFAANNGTIYDEPLITNGIADSSSRTFAGIVGDQVGVADAGLRYVDEPVTYQLDAGHGTSRGALIAALAAQAGVANSDVGAVPGTTNKPLDIVEGDWLSLAQEMASVRGWRLLWDRYGVLTAVDMGFEVAANRGPIRWSFGLADIVMGVNGSAQGGIVIDPAPEAFTKITTRGSKQVVQNPNCAQQSDTTTVTSTGPFAFTLLPYQQDSGGTVTTTGALSPPAVNYTLSETTLVETTECGDEVLSQATTYRLFNPPVARYERLASGAITTNYSIVYLGGNGASDVAFQYDREKFIETDRVIERTSFDSDGFVDEEVREVWGYYNPRRHVRSRTDLNDPWDTQTADSNWNDRGNGEGVVFSHATLRLIERQTITYGVQDGYIRSRVTSLETWAAAPGATYLYGGGQEFGESQETFQESRRIEESFDFVGSGFRTTVNEYTVGNTFAGTTVTRSNGGPPAAKKRRAGANGSDRYEQQEIEAECSAPTLLSVRRPLELNGLYVEWAEDEFELKLVCDRNLISGQSPQVTFTIPANPAIQPGDWGHLSGPAGMEVDFLVTDVETTGPKTGPILTTVSSLAIFGGV